MEGYWSSICENTKITNPPIFTLWKRTKSEKKQLDVSISKEISKEAAFILVLSVLIIPKLENSSRNEKSKKSAPFFCRLNIEIVLEHVLRGFIKGYYSK